MVILHIRISFIIRFNSKVMFKYKNSWKSLGFTPQRLDQPINSLIPQLCLYKLLWVSELYHYPFFNNIKLLMYWWIGSITLEEKRKIWSISCWIIIVNWMLIHLKGWGDCCMLWYWIMVMFLVHLYAWRIYVWLGCVAYVCISMNVLRLCLNLSMLWLTSYSEFTLMNDQVLRERILSCSHTHELWKNWWSFLYYVMKTC